MCGWNNNVGGNLLMKNNKGGWNDQGGVLRVFSSVNTFIRVLIVLD